MICCTDRLAHSNDKQLRNKILGIMGLVGCSMPMPATVQKSQCCQRSRLMSLPVACLKKYDFSCTEYDKYNVDLNLSFQSPLN